MESYNVVFNHSTGKFTFQDTTDWAGMGINPADMVANVQIIAPDGSTHYQNGNSLGTFVTGTAQAGSLSSITLAAGASSTDDFFKNLYSLITGGTGAGQKPKVTAYSGSTKIASAVFGVATSSSSTYKFCLNDLFIAANTNSQGSIPLLLDINGNIVAGTYTFNMFYYNTNTLATTLATQTYDYGFTFPTGEITPSVDMWGAYVKATDITNYTVLTVTPSLARTFTLNYPPTVVPTPAPVVVTSAVVSTTQVYSPATYGAVLSTIATWNMGGGFYIIGTITAVESIDVNIDNNLCSLQCCLREGIERLNTLECGGYIAEANTARRQLTLAIGYYLGVQGAIYCGSQAKIDEYTAKFKKALNCNDECTCNDGDAPTLVTPVIGSGTTYTFTSSDGTINLLVVPSGSNTDVDITLSPSLLAAIYATTDISGLVNVVVTEVSPDVFTIQGATLTAGIGISIVPTLNGDSIVTDYKVILQNLLSSQSADVNSTTAMATIKFYTIPAGTLATNGDRLKIEVNYKLASNTNVKNYRVRINSTNIIQEFSENRLSVAYVTYFIEIIRISATSVVYKATYQVLNSIWQEIFSFNSVYDNTTTQVAVTDLNSTSNQILVQGQGVTAGTDLIVQDLSVEIIKH